MVLCSSTFCPREGFSLAVYLKTKGYMVTWEENKTAQTFCWYRYICWSDIVTIYIILQGHPKAQYLKMGLCSINSITNLLDGLSGNTFKETHWKWSSSFRMASHPSILSFYGLSTFPLQLYVVFDHSRLWLLNKTSFHNKYSIKKRRTYFHTI